VRGAWRLEPDPPREALGRETRPQTRMISFDTRITHTYASESAVEPRPPLPPPRASDFDSHGVAAVTTKGARAREHASRQPCHGHALEACGYRGTAVSAETQGRATTHGR